MTGGKVKKSLGPYDSTHERILETALGLFSTKGYQGASTREIAQEAGVAEVTLFRHFPSKERLLQEVLSRFSVLPSLKAYIPAALELPYEEALTGMADHLFDTLVQIKDWVRVMQAEVQRSPEKLLTVFHGFIDDLFDTYASFFRELQQRGNLGDFDPEYAARAFHGIVFCYFSIEELLHRKQYKANDRGEAIRQFMRIFALGTVSRPADR
ncbi:TetR/AcrR family transcriptional regulator [Geobacter sp.]|uniref:TetR/AcrR family transcriptional regulator n=1 Tax=Geobacter sp. TaxID=46610 RepID=UPI002616FE0E|nr:TetR/AcrR family transcriptional regulator [Geobacter sp.]